MYRYTDSEYQNYESDDLKSKKQNKWAVVGVIQDVISLGLQIYSIYKISQKFDCKNFQQKSCTIDDTKKSYYAPTEIPCDKAEQLNCFSVDNFFTDEFNLYYYSAISPFQITDLLNFTFAISIFLFIAQIYKLILFIKRKKLNGAEKIQYFYMYYLVIIMINDGIFFQMQTDCSQGCAVIEFNDSIKYGRMVFALGTYAFGLGMLATAILLIGSKCMCVDFFKRIESWSERNYGKKDYIMICFKSFFIVVSIVLYDISSSLIVYSMKKTILGFTITTFVLSIFSFIYSFRIIFKVYSYFKESRIKNYEDDSSNYQTGQKQDYMKQRIINYDYSYK